MFADHVLPEQKLISDRSMELAAYDFLPVAGLDVPAIFSNADYFFSQPLVLLTQNASITVLLRSIPEVT